MASPSHCLVFLAIQFGAAALHLIHRHRAIYDEEKKYEVMCGLIALLRPEKIPFIIKSFPISELPEKYLQYEKEKKEEEERKLQEDNDLPF